MIKKTYLKLTNVISVGILTCEGVNQSEVNH